MYNLLENQYIHDFIQGFLSIGRGRAIRMTEELIDRNCVGKVLDIGCGTKRYAHLFGKDYIGIDINKRYLSTKKHIDKNFICADAINLPFKNAAFDSIFVIGFFHHIDTNDTAEVFKEIIRISRPLANILIIEAFYPENKYDILGYTLVKLDRGRYIRTRKAFTKELCSFFTIIDSCNVNYSYPYNVHTFLCKKYLNHNDF